MISLMNCGLRFRHAACAGYYDLLSRIRRPYLTRSSFQKGYVFMPFGRA